LFNKVYLLRFLGSFPKDVFGIDVFDDFKNGKEIFKTGIIAL
jgi:hypothetical protein